MEDKKCFNCKTPESEVPVVNMRYKNKELWVCPRCIPSMIHEPQLVEQSLTEAEKA